MDIRAEYHPRTDVDWSQLKKDTLKYVCGNYDDGRVVTEDDIYKEFIPLWNTLKSVDFNINRFFSGKLYHNIKDCELLSDYLLTVCFTKIKPVSDYVVDLMNDYIDLLSIDKSIAAGAEWHPADEIEILEYLWYCVKDEDIWWLLGQGIGNIQDMYKLYMGTVQIPEKSNGHYPPYYYNKSEKKALLMILFLEFNFAYKNEALATSTRNMYSNAESRKIIWKLLIPELTDDAWGYLAQKYELSAAQIYNVAIRYLSTIDDLPSGWGMDLYSRITILTDYCYVECHPDISKTKQ